MQISSPNAARPPPPSADSLQDADTDVNSGAGNNILSVARNVLEQIRPTNLGVGSRGENVADLQRDLNEAGHDSGEVDGIFGSNTLNAVQQFQQERIEFLEELRNGADAGARGPLNSIIQALKSEQADGIAGEQTQVQLESVDTPSAKPPADTPARPPSFPTSPIPLPVPERVGEPGLPEIDFPDNTAIEGALDAAQGGDINAALEESLNSTGDSVELEIGVHGSLPVIVPGTKLGIDTEINVGVTRVEDGYELSLGADIAGQLGLEVADPLSAQLTAELGGEIVYHYDTLAEVQQAVADQALTAGNHPAIEEIVSLGADATRLADDVATRIANLPVVGDILEAGETVTDAVIDRIPEEVTIGAGPFAYTQSIPGVREIKELWNQRQAIIESRNELIDGFEGLVTDAKDRIDEAYEGAEISFAVGAEAKLGIPLPVQFEGLELGVQGGVAAKGTLSTNADGSYSVSYSYTANAGGSAEAGVGAKLAVENSVTITQDFARDANGDFRTDGDAEVAFSGDISAATSVGGGVSVGSGVGSEYSYTIQVSHLTGRVQDAASAFLSGDADGALESLGSIKGSLDLQDRATASVGFGLGASSLGASLGIDGEFSLNDKGQAISVDGLSLEEAFEFAQNEVTHAIASLPA